MPVLDLKGFKVVNGTTLIKVASSNNKGGDELYKFAQILVSRQVHKALKDLAWERDIPLRELLVDIIENFLNKEQSWQMRKKQQKGRSCLKTWQPNQVR